jgi:hypothetical protein
VKQRNTGAAHLQALFRAFIRTQVESTSHLPPPSARDPLAVPTMASTVRIALQTPSRNVKTTLQRGIATSAPRAFNIPPRYGNGPLYQTKLSPKDAITHADAPVLRMLMVNIIGILIQSVFADHQCRDRPYSLANPGRERERSHPSSLQSMMSPSSQQEMYCVRTFLNGPFPNDPLKFQT